MREARRVCARDDLAPGTARCFAVAVSQDGAGKVLLVSLDETNGARSVSVEERTVGRTRFDRLEIGAADIGDQPALVKRIHTLADPDLAA